MLELRVLQGDKTAKMLMLTNEMANSVTLVAPILCAQFHFFKQAFTQTAVRRQIQKLTH